MNYHFFPELVCKTKKKRTFYIDHMLKSSARKGSRTIRKQFINYISDLSIKLASLPSRLPFPSFKAKVLVCNFGLQCSMWHGIWDIHPRKSIIVQRQNTSLYICDNCARLSLVARFFILEKVVETSGNCLFSRSLGSLMATTGLHHHISVLFENNVVVVVEVKNWDCREFGRRAARLRYDTRGH